MDRKKLLIFLISLISVAIICCGAFFLVPELTDNSSKSDPTSGPSSPTDEPAGDYTDYFDDFICITATYGETPAESLNFCWQTFESIPSCKFEYAKGSYTTTAEFEKASPVFGSVVSEEYVFSIPEDGQFDYKNPTLTEVNGYVHRVYLTGLEPDTYYTYRIYDENNHESTVKSVKTAPSGDTYSYIMINDSQGFIQSNFAFFGAVLDSAKENFPDYDFILDLGDNIEEGKNLYQWQMLFNEASELSSTPIVDVAGNKDKKHTLYHFTNGSEDNRTALVSGYYSFDLGDIHYSVLNTGDTDNDIAKAQLKWLKKDLQNAEGKTKVVILHKAVYSNANHNEDEEILNMREQLMPYFTNYNVSVVLEAHDHYLFRSKPVNSLSEVINSTATVKTYEATNYTTSLSGETTVYESSDGSFFGTIFFMNGSAGIKQHDGKIDYNAEDVYYEKAENTAGPTYTHVTVSGSSMKFDTYLVADGKSQLIDSFEIKG